MTQFVYLSAFCNYADLQALTRLDRTGGGVRFSGFENAVISGLFKNMSYWYYGFEGKYSFGKVGRQNFAQVPNRRFSIWPPEAIKSGQKTG